MIKDHSITRCLSVLLLNRNINIALCGARKIVIKIFNEWDLGVFGMNSAMSPEKAGFVLMDRQKNDNRIGTELSEMNTRI